MQTQTHKRRTRGADTHPDADADTDTDADTDADTVIDTGTDTHQEAARARSPEGTTDTHHRHTPQTHTTDTHHRHRAQDTEHTQRQRQKQW